MLIKTQVFWSALGQGNDERLVELYPTSIADNTEWHILTVLLPVSRPTDGKVRLENIELKWVEINLICVHIGVAIFCCSINLLKFGGQIIFKAANNKSFSKLSIIKPFNFSS